MNQKEMEILEARNILGEGFSNLDDQEISKLIDLVEGVVLFVINHDLSETSLAESNTYKSQLSKNNTLAIDLEKNNT